MILQNVSNNYFPNFKPHYFHLVLYFCFSLLRILTPWMHLLGLLVLLTELYLLFGSLLLSHQQYMVQNQVNTQYLLFWKTRCACDRIGWWSGSHGGASVNLNQGLNTNWFIKDKLMGYRMWDTVMVHEDKWSKNQTMASK